MIAIIFESEPAPGQKDAYLEAHRAIQEAGRQSIFASYRLRVAEVLRDYGKDDRAQAPEDSRRRHA